MGQKADRFGGSSDTDTLRHFRYRYGPIGEGPRTALNQQLGNLWAEQDVFFRKNLTERGSRFDYEPPDLGDRYDIRPTFVNFPSFVRFGVWRPGVVMGLPYTCWSPCPFRSARVRGLRMHVSSCTRLVQGPLRGHPAPNSKKFRQNCVS